MDVAVRFSQSAFKHSVSEDAIRCAIINVLYDDILDEANDKHLLIGFDDKSNILEILYNIIDDKTIRVFHAMKCRDMYIALIEH